MGIIKSVSLKTKHGKLASSARGAHAANEYLNTQTWNSEFRNETYWPDVSAEIYSINNKYQINFER